MSKPKDTQEPTQASKIEEIPLRKNWWLSIQNEKGSEKFEAFDFIKIKLRSDEIEIPVTSIMVKRIDGLVSESHSIVSKLIHINIESLEKEKYQLEAKLAEAEAENKKLRDAAKKYLNIAPTDGWHFSDCSMEDHEDGDGIICTCGAGFAEQELREALKSEEK